MFINQILVKLKSLVYSKSEMDTALITKANDSAVVHTSGAEDISGNKNFIDNLTRGGKNVDVIEEQGDGYIRYSNGLQICYGNGIYSKDTRITYSRAFVGPNTMCIVVNGGHPRVVVNATEWQSSSFRLLTSWEGDDWASWIAIGPWK